VRSLLSGVVPQLGEGLLEQVGGVQALVGRPQQLEVLSSVTGEILWMRQQCVLLALDEPTPDGYAPAPPRSATFWARASQD
jgi:hypothetical protein